MDSLPTLLGAPMVLLAVLCGPASGTPAPRAERLPDKASDQTAGELAPGVRIERARPDRETTAAHRRLRSWRELYGQRLLRLRAATGRLFDELEGSSLAALSDRCREIGRAVGRVDRRGLFASGDVELDRVLFGALERFRAGAAECVGGRYLNAYRLLVEARMGLVWVDRRIEHRLRPTVPLVGLDSPD